MSQRALCESAKRGRRCSDDLCRGMDVTLCGFDEELWNDLTDEPEDYWHQEDDDNAVEGDRSQGGSRDAR